MLILKVLEKVWIIAAISALGVAVYNWFAHGDFSHLVYFPLFIALSCFVLFLNIRSQIKFKKRQLEGLKRAE